VIAHRMRQDSWRGSSIEQFRELSPNCGSFSKLARSLRESVGKLARFTWRPPPPLLRDAGEDGLPNEAGVFRERIDGFSYLPARRRRATKQSQVTLEIAGLATLLVQRHHCKTIEGASVDIGAHRRRAVQHRLEIRCCDLWHLHSVQPDERPQPSARVSGPKWKSLPIMMPAHLWHAGGNGAQRVCKLPLDQKRLTPKQRDAAVVLARPQPRPPSDLCRMKAAPFVIASLPYRIILDREICVAETGSVSGSRLPSRLLPDGPPP